MLELEFLITEKLLSFLYNDMNQEKCDRCKKVNCTCE